MFGVSVDSAAKSVNYDLLPEDEIPHLPVALKFFQQLMRDPESLTCPISHELYVKPVIDGVGNTYDEANIKAHFAQLKSKNLSLTSPLTNEPLSSDLLIENRQKKSEALQYKTDMANKCIETAKKCLERNCGDSALLLLGRVRELNPSHTELQKLEQLAQNTFLTPDKQKFHYCARAKKALAANDSKTALALLKPLLPPISWIPTYCVIDLPIKAAEVLAVSEDGCYTLTLKYKIITGQAVKSDKRFGIYEIWNNKTGTKEFKIAVDAQETTDRVQSVGSIFVFHFTGSLRYIDCNSKDREFTNIEKIDANNFLLFPSGCLLISQSSDVCFYSFKTRKMQIVLKNACRTKSCDYDRLEYSYGAIFRSPYSLDVNDIERFPYRYDGYDTFFTITITTSYLIVPEGDQIKLIQKSKLKRLDNPPKECKMQGGYLEPPKTLPQDLVCVGGEFYAISSKNGSVRVEKYNGTDFDEKPTLCVSSEGKVFYNKNHISLLTKDKVKSCLDFSNQPSRPSLVKCSFEIPVGLLQHKLLAVNNDMIVIEQLATKSYYRKCVKSYKISNVYDYKKHEKDIDLIAVALEASIKSIDYETFAMAISHLVQYHFSTKTWNKLENLAPVLFSEEFNSFVLRLLSDANTRGDSTAASRFLLYLGIMQSDSTKRIEAYKVAAKLNPQCDIAKYALRQSYFQTSEPTGHLFGHLYSIKELVPSEHQGDLDVHMMGIFDQLKRIHSSPVPTTSSTSRHPTFSSLSSSSPPSSSPEQELLKGSKFFNH